MPESKTETDQCERDDCTLPGTTYYSWAGRVSNAPIPYTGNGSTPLPDQPIRLCHGHALDAFGVAFPPAKPECHCWYDGPPCPRHNEDGSER